jgi:osmotically-inducible protein OsmY
MNPGRRRFLTGLCAAPTAMLSGCAAPPSPTPDQDAAADRQTALRVKAAMSHALGLAAAPIEVDVVDGVVTLRGFTATGAERDRAASAAQGVERVQGVRNRIEVRE